MQIPPGAALFVNIVVVIFHHRLSLFLVDLLHHTNDDLRQKCLTAFAHFDDILVIGLLVAFAVRNAFVRD